MKFSSPLVRGTLLQRYKRFLADVALDDGGTITAAVPNTGTMMGLSQPGLGLWLSTNEQPSRKYRHTLELVELPGDDATGTAKALVGINTGLPNRLVAEALANGVLEPLSGYRGLRREVKYGINSRIDILLEDPSRGQCYVEIKNVHLSRTRGLAEFPDCVTERGAKHLAELAAMVDQGHRAVMIYLVQRFDTDRFTLAADLDPTYATAFAAARGKGVEAFACRCRVTPEEIVAVDLIPIL